jgi:hypothetical protein
MSGDTRKHTNDSEKDSVCWTVQPFCYGCRKIVDIDSKAFLANASLVSTLDQGTVLDMQKAVCGEHHLHHLLLRIRAAVAAELPPNSVAAYPGGIKPLAAAAATPNKDMLLLLLLLLTSCAEPTEPT